MSYPQPDATQYVQKLYSSWNLSTPLSSPGDIYQSEQGSLAFCVGPDSDIANVAFAYFDDQLPTRMHFDTISPTRSFTSLIAARLDPGTVYLPSKRPGRILFWSADIYDPNYQPSAFVSGDRMQVIPPILNVIQYFQPSIGLVPERTDREYLFQAYNPPGGKTEYIVVPYYGRKYCYIHFTNGNPTDSNTFGIIGVNYAITQNGSPVVYHQETTILTPTVVTPGGGAAKVIVRASNQGMFDALVFSVTNGGPAPLRIIMSDQGQG